LTSARFFGFSDFSAQAICREAPRPCDRPSTRVVMSRMLRCLTPVVLCLGVQGSGVADVVAAAAAAAGSATTGQAPPGLRGAVAAPNASASIADEVRTAATTALGSGDGQWTLNGDRGPYCPDWAVPARESASSRGAGDAGWDPCCAFSGCNIFEAVWDSGMKKWCFRDDFWKNGNTCGDDYWTGGFLYDYCPCSGDDTYNCENGKKQRCIAGATSGWTPDAWMLGQCGQGRDVCYGGMILAPYSNGQCPDNFFGQDDYNNVWECVPNWS